MPDLAKKITPGFQALLVIVSILTAFISISYFPMQKRVKMVWRRSSVVMGSVISER